jgi:cytochrome b561
MAPQQRNAVEGLHEGRTNGLSCRVKVLERRVPFMIRNTRTSWGSISRLLHWGLGFVVVGMIAYGWWMNHVPARPDRFFYRSIHADIGYVVLLLMVVRLIWRWINPAPALPADTPRWQQFAARVSHGALYGVTMLVAILGWAHSGAHKPDYADWFGLFRMPQITSTDKLAADAYEGRHIFFAYVLLALIAIHVVAAIWHHFVKRDRVTARMIDGVPDEQLSR